MSCIQATFCQPGFNVKKICHLRFMPPIHCASPSLRCSTASLQLNTGLSINQCAISANTLVILTTVASKRQHCTPVCLFGGKEKSENEKEASPWKSIEKAIGSLKKEQSIENVLREQMERQDLYDDGGSGRGGGGDGGGSGDGSGGSEDEGFSGILDETVQVVLATIGFIFLYIYIINGEEINVLAKDLLKFLFSGQRSFRLRRLMDQWGWFFQRLNKRKREVDPYWLERAIITTPTWWDSPEKYKRILRAYLASKYDNGE